MKTSEPSDSTGFRENLLKTMAKVDRPGSVHISRDLPLTMPGLEVDGIGPIRFPLGKTQARALIKKCSRAPYGKGTVTLVDTSVRRVWELDPALFRLSNPQWEELVTQITDEARVGLGLQKHALKPHLYKLLVYEEGGFFLPHRDGEKLDGMVATLVIALPSIHSGGELIITHEGKSYEVPLKGAASGLELSYAAFYADCEHEVRPVTDGYRLCLVYNLTLARSGAKKGIAAPQTTETVESLCESLRGWTSSQDLSKIAVALEHQYTQEGLRIDLLKGVDRARAEVLFAAAEQAECSAYLALITHWQSGSAEGGYDGGGYGRGRRSRWSYDDEDEDEYESSDASDYEMGEIFDETLTINHWSDRDGNKVSFGEMDLEEAEIVSDIAPDDWDVSREDFEGFTGNAGMTLERWYHRAAVVIWPEKRTFEVLCDAGTDASIAGLKSMVLALKKVPKSAQQAQREKCLEFAKAIIKTWAEPRVRSYSASISEKTDRSTFLVSLQTLDDPDLVRRFLTEIMSTNGDLQLDGGFTKFCKANGWQNFQESLTAIFDNATNSVLLRNAEMLEILCLQRDKNADRLGVCHHLAAVAIGALERFDKRRSENSWQDTQLKRDYVFRVLVKSLITIRAAKPLASLIEHVQSHKSKYDFTGVQLAAIFALDSFFKKGDDETSRVMTRWLADCRGELEKRTAKAPLPPADFRRPAKLTCQCADCSELSRFLADPNESTYHFRVAKERRRHLHGIIDSNGCDLTHVTTRTGSPHTLVCKKTDASFQAAVKIHERDCENLRRLKAIEATTQTKG